MTGRPVRLRWVATAGVTIVLGVLGPSALVSGAAAGSPAGAIGQTLPTRIPQPGGVSPTAGRSPSPSTPRVVPTPTPRASASSVAPVQPAPATTAAGPNWWQWALVGLVGLLVGAAGCFLVVRPRRHVPAPIAAPTGAAAPSSAGRPSQAWPATSGRPESEQLARLVSSVIAARDLLDPHSVMAQRLGAALSGGGVQELVPIGQPFDPSRHHAVGTAGTTDPATANRIAEVQRVGYTDAHHTIRPPEVVVFRLDAPR